MDDIGKVLHDRIKADFEKRIEADRSIAAIMKKIGSGKADLNDTAKYSVRLGELIKASILDCILPSDLPQEKMYYNIAKSILEPLLHDNYDRINAVCADVQRSLDKKIGINLKPFEVDYPDERIRSALNGVVAKETAVESVDVLGRTAKNITASANDDFVEKNAQYRSKAGLDVFIDRKDDGNCCPWCSKLAGRYRYPEDIPDDVFKRHDNCGCLVSYVNARGGGRQNVHTKRWVNEQAKAKRIEYAASVEKPVKLSENEAKELEKGLLEAKRGKDDNAIANLEYINSQAFADKFKGKYENEQVEQAVVSACRKIVKNRNGTFFEEAYFIDAQTGRTISYVKGKQKYGIEMPEKLKKLLTNANEKSIIMIHNHPNSSPLSRTDYLTSSNYKSCYEALAVGHNGDVFSFKDTFETQGSFLGYFVENGKKYPYYEAIRDYKIAYTKYTLRGQDDFQARNMAWEDVSRMRGFTYEKK